LRNVVEQLGLRNRHVTYLEALFSKVAHHLYASVILTGSWAAGDATNSSDLDLILVAENESTKVEIVETLFKVVIYNAERANHLSWSNHELCKRARLNNEVINEG